MSAREADRPTPGLWWSPKLDSFVGEHRSESGNYEVIGYDREGWYVADEQEIDLPPDAVAVSPPADLPATLASVDDVRREALALIDDLMRGQEHALDQPGIARGWTAGVQWRADRWAELVARRNALAVQNGGDR